MFSDEVSLGKKSNKHPGKSFHSLVNFCSLKIKFNSTEHYTFCKSQKIKWFLKCLATVFILLTVLQYFYIYLFETVNDTLNKLIEYNQYQKSRLTQVWLKIKISISSVACNVSLCHERQLNAIALLWFIHWSVTKGTYWLRPEVECEVFPHLALGSLSHFCCFSQTQLGC